MPWFYSDFNLQIQMKYRKKPVVIEAVLASVFLAETRNETPELPDWLKTAHQTGVVTIANDAIYIRTSEGVMRGEPTDLIIQGGKGELYPCKPDIFAATYDAVVS